MGIREASLILLFVPIASIAIASSRGDAQAVDEPTQLPSDFSDEVVSEHPITRHQSREPLRTAAGATALSERVDVLSECVETDKSGEAPGRGESRSPPYDEILDRLNSVELSVRVLNETNPVEGEKFGTNSIVSLAAALIALCALATSVWQGVLNRRHARASVLPHLALTHRNRIDQALGFGVANRGIGPAKINSIVWIVNGKRYPLTDIDHVDEALSALDLAGVVIEGTTFDEGMLIAPTEERVIMSFPEHVADAEMQAKLQEKLSATSIEIAYTSVYGDKFHAAQ